MDENDGFRCAAIEDYGLLPVLLIDHFRAHGKLPSMAMFRLSCRCFKTSDEELAKAYVSAAEIMNDPALCAWARAPK